MNRKPKKDGTDPVSFVTRIALLEKQVSFLREKHDATPANIEELFRQVNDLRVRTEFLREKLDTQATELTTTELAKIDNSGKWVVISGNVADGHTFWGPFTDPNSASEWAEKQRAFCPWSIVTVNSPEWRDDEEEG